MQLDKPGSKDTQKKDKLAETKRAEREKKELHKAELQRQKEQKLEEEHKLKTTYKDLRAQSHSKRAEREHRQAERKAIRAESGQECQHGIWRCRICFPRPTAGQRRVHHDELPIATDIDIAA